MGRLKGGAALAFNIESWVARPLDARTVVDTVADLTNETVWASSDGNVYVFLGLVVSVTKDIPENNGVYFLKGLPVTEITNWEKLGGGSGGTTNYNLLTNLPKLNGIVISGDKTNVDYNIIIPENLSQFNNDTGFITETATNLVNYYNKTEVDNKLEALNHISIEIVDVLPATGVTDIIYLVPESDYYVQFIYTGGEWERIGTTQVDLSKYFTKDEITGLLLLKQDALTTEQLDNIANVPNKANKTDLDLKQNKLVAGTNITIDEATNTISSSADSGTVYNNLEPSVVAVGAISPGTTFTDYTFAKLMEAAFYKELNPTLANPTTNGAITPSILEVGIAGNFELSIVANRGTINPAYGTNGMRAGLPTNYSFNVTGNTDFANQIIASVDSGNMREEQSVNAYTFDAPTVITFTPSITYSAGEQPKTSYDNDYNVPYAGGVVPGTAKKVNVVLPYFATTGNIATLTKFVSVIENYIEVTMVGESGGNKQALELPATFNVTRITQLNTLSGNYDEINLTNFTTTTFDKDINGIDFSYERLENNLGTIGERTLRFYI